MNDSRVLENADLGRVISSAFPEGSVTVVVAHDELTLLTEASNICLQGGGDDR